MDKKDKKISKNHIKVDKNKDNQKKDGYEYNFIPNLNEWLNIDRQRERTKELEDI